MPARIPINFDEIIESQKVKSQEIMEEATSLYPKKDMVENIEVEKLLDNPNNRFHKIEGEKWEEFLGSIKEHGIQVPLIVRPVGTNYEIIAGHNRKRGAIESGIVKVPCLVKDIDDVEASVLVAITNSQRENTTEIEWGWAYRNTYELLKRPSGERTDLTCDHEGHRLENETDLTCPHEGNRLEKGKKTVDIVAEKYGVGKNTVHRKIRLTYLLRQLYDYCKSKKVSQDVMVELSYLTEETQFKIMSCFTEYEVEITKDFVKVIRELEKEQDGDVDIKDLYRLCEAENNSSGKSRSGVKAKAIKYTVPDGVLPGKINANNKKQVEEYILKALTYILENGIEL